MPKSSNIYGKHIAGTYLHSFCEHSLGAPVCLYYFITKKGQCQLIEVV